MEVTQSTKGPQTRTPSAQWTIRLLRSTIGYGLDESPRKVRLGFLANKNNGEISDHFVLNQPQKVKLIQADTIVGLVLLNGSGVPFIECTV